MLKVRYFSSHYNISPISSKSNGERRAFASKQESDNQLKTNNDNSAFWFIGGGAAMFLIFMDIVEWGVLKNVLNLGRENEPTQAKINKEINNTLSQLTKKAVIPAEKKA